MAGISNKASHVDPSNYSVYDTSDLEYFQSILNDIMEDYELRGALSLHEREYLKMRLAAAIFKRADEGERDYVRLKHSAIEAVSPVPFPDAAS